MKKTAIVLATLSLLLTGCAGASDEEQATTNITESIVDDGGFLVGEADLDVTEDDATCVSEGVVEAVGVENLQEAGVLQDDMTVDGAIADADLASSDREAVDGVLADCLGEQIAKANVKASILEQDLAGASVDEADATCLSDGIVDEIGVEKLQDYGLLNDQLALEDEVGEVTMQPEDADAMAGVFVDCVDAEKMIEDQFSSMLGNLTQPQQECMKDILDEDKIREIMSATFQGDVAGMQSDLQQDFMQCVRP